MNAGLTKAKRILSAAGACLLVVVAPLCGQTPVGADALSASAVTDSQRVLRDLSIAITKNRQDAGTWFHQGMVAWTLYLRAESTPRLSGLDAIDLRRHADSSLIIAAELVPKNAVYQLAAGELLRTATDIGPRLRGNKYFERTYELTKNGRDSALHARAAIGMGRLRWLSYEVNAHMLARPKKIREPLKASPSGADALPDPPEPCDDLAASLDSAAHRGGGNSGIVNVATSGRAGAMMLHRSLADCARLSKAEALGDYTRAEDLFREAARFAPHDARIFRHLAMLLAEKNRWRELASAAAERTNRVPTDAWGWLTQGLALHRGGDATAAKRSFETGLRHLDPRERGRLFAFARLMTRNDSIQFTARDSASRATRENTFWEMVDPLWSRAGNDPRTEFLSRVTYAELRWSVEERRVRGADSDRGEVYIRYGPPRVIFTLSGCDFQIERLQCGNGPGRPPPDQTQRPPRSAVVTFWDYDRTLAVIFWAVPSYGTAHYPGPDRGHIDEIVESRPVSFDNIVAEKILDLPTQLVRFRATADSVDLLLAMHAPVDTIRAASGLDAPARLDFWLIPRDPAVAKEFRDSATMRGAGVGRWIRRLPSNDYFYRLEATADGSMTAARALGWITAGRDTASGFATRGFGMSDILLTTEARPAKAQPVRWSDYGIAPVLQAVPKGTTLQLVWENYELGNRAGQAEYTVDVSLERIRTGAGAIVAAVTSALARAVGVDRDRNSVRYHFERSTAHAQAIVDVMAVNLAATPAGDYRITIEIVDAMSGRKTSASSVFSIRE